MHPDGGLVPSTLLVVQRRYPLIFCRRAEAEGGRPTYLTRRAMERGEGESERRAAQVCLRLRVFAQARSAAATTI